MTALYERFLDPRDEGFRDPARWDEAATLGHTGRRYLTEDELYAAALEREPDATPERRAELRLEAGKAARQNVAFLDVTFSVQKSVTVLHTAFEAQEVKARAGGRRRDRGRRGRRTGRRSRTRSGRATTPRWPTWPSKAGYSRVGHHGGAAGRWVDAHDWTSRRSSSTTPATTTRSCTSTTRSSTASQGPDGEWRTLDGRSAVPLAAGRGRGRRAGDRGAPDPRARRAGRDPPGRQGPRDRRRRPGGDGPVLLPPPGDHREDRRAGRAFEARYGRAPNALELDRLAAAGHLRDPAGEVARRRDPRGAAGPAGTRSCAPRSPAAWPASRTTCSTPRGEQPATAQAWSPQAVIETGAGRGPAAQGRRGPAPTSPAAINDALPDHLGDLDGADDRPAARQAHRRGARATRVRWTAPAPGDDAAARRAAAGQRRLRLPGARRARSTRPRSTCTPSALLVAATARRRRRGAAAAGRGAAVPRRAAPSPGSSSAPTRPPRCAASSPPARGSSRWSARPAPASRSSSARSPRPGATPPCGAAPAAAGVRAGRLARSPPRSSPAKA